MSYFYYSKYIILLYCIIFFIKIKFYFSINSIINTNIYTNIYYILMDQDQRNFDNGKSNE